MGLILNWNMKEISKSLCLFAFIRIKFTITTFGSDCLGWVIFLTVSIISSRIADNGTNSGAMSSFSSLLLWILGGASSEGLNSFLSIFRDVRDQGQVYADPAPAEDRTNQNLR